MLSCQNDSSDPSDVCFFVPQSRTMEILGVLSPYFFIDFSTLLSRVAFWIRTTVGTKMFLYARKWVSFFPRFQKVLRVMIGHEPSWYWKIMWAFASPVLIVSLFVFYITDYIRTGTLQYQAWDATEVLHSLQLISLIAGSWMLAAIEVRDHSNFFLKPIYCIKLH